MMDQGYGQDVMYQAGPANELIEDWEDWMRWDAMLGDPPTTAKGNTEQIEKGPGTEVLGHACEDQQTFPNFPDYAQFGEEDASISAVGYNHSTFSHYGREAAPFSNGRTELSPPATINSRPSVSSDGSAPRGRASSAISSYSNPVDGQAKQPRTLHIASKDTLNVSTVPFAESPASPRLSSSSEQVKQDNRRKRKSSEDDTDESRKASQAFRGRPVKKTAHNVIEKRYRLNLNEKIAALRDSVPSLRSSSHRTAGNDVDKGADNEVHGESLDGFTAAQKLNKGTVISKATEYIHHLERHNKTLGDEMKILKARLSALEELVTGAPNSTSRLSGSPWMRTPLIGSRPLSAHMWDAASWTSEPNANIQTPDNMRGLHMTPNQPVSAQWQSANHGQASPVTRSSAANAEQLAKTSRRGSSFVNKLMVGSLAGLMVIEGFGQKQEKQNEPLQSGLFAAPVKLFQRSDQYGEGSTGPLILPSGPAAQGMFQILKIFLVLAAAIYLLYPLSTFRPRRKTNSPPPHVHLSAAPSLAVPVEVRRKAWLTAIQTVWVPRHSFPLEAAALGMKTVRLSLYKLIGWEAYMLLTGITKEEEAARVKAWEIALDAQLTGGDAEITKSRLVLTLMAAGTLPDTPLMLMHKALHIRILLWEAANSGYAGSSIVEWFAARLARSCWDAARKGYELQESKIAHSSTASELLPEHLAVLLRQDCDDVLVPEITQRAYNLAWNKPTAENAEVDEPMDGVVDDSAIHSPLDALAAWWSCLILRRGLAQHLESRGGGAEGAESDLCLALAAAPPHSGVQLRSLIARAVLSSDNRHHSITAACELLPPRQTASPSQSPRAPPTPPLINEIGKTAVASDVRTSLSFAMCLAISHSSVSSISRRTITTILSKTTIHPSSLTLLSFIAARQVLHTLSQDPGMVTGARRIMEHVACSLRVWIGSDRGRRTGISRAARERLVEECLDASRRLVGLHVPSLVHNDGDGDDGYVSLSETEGKCS